MEDAGRLCALSAMDREEDVERLWEQFISARVEGIRLVVADTGCDEDEIVQARWFTVDLRPPHGARRIASLQAPGFRPIVTSLERSG